MINPIMTLTKTYKLEQLDAILNKFYGNETRLSNKVRRLPKETINRLYEVAWLNRNDPLAEQVRILESWIKNYV